MNTLSADFFSFSWNANRPADITNKKSTAIEKTWVGESSLITSSTGYITFQSTIHAVPTLGFSLLVTQVEPAAPESGHTVVHKQNSSGEFFEGFSK